MKPVHLASKRFLVVTLFALLLLVAAPAGAWPRPPLPPWPERALNVWRFDSESTWGGPLAPPWALQRVALSESWSGYALTVGPGQPAEARFPAFKSNGQPNLTLGEGTIRFWFSPHWTSVAEGGKGPGSFARLIEVGEASLKATAWWALHLDAAGDTLHFSAQAKGVSADYLKAPISWRAGEWHQVALVYSPKFSGLYLDGVLVAEGEGVSVAPDVETLAATGFRIGGDASGMALAIGDFDELTTFAHACSAAEIVANYRMSAPQAARGTVSVAEHESRRAVGALGKASLAGEAGEGEGMMRFLGGPGAPASPCGTNLCLAIELAGDHAVLTLWNTQPGTNYQIFSRTEVFHGAFADPALSGTAVLEQELVGVDGRNWTQTVIPMAGRSNLFFWARSQPAGEPHLHITSTNCPVLPQPYVQIRGYSETPLATLGYTVLNAEGATNGVGFVTQQAYDAAAGQLTTNWWQCFDVELAAGFNRVVIQAVDRQGRSNSTTLHFAQLYLPERAPPQSTVAFPPPGMTVSGTNFTLRGSIDNPTARVLVQSTNGGTTRTHSGVVERDGTFWVGNLPLTPGENSFALIVMDSGGVASTNPISVAGAVSGFAMVAPLSSAGLYQPTLNVSGTVDEGGYAVTVNGVAAIVSGTSWTAYDVPSGRGGVAIFTATASLPNGPTYVTEVAVDKPTRVFLSNLDRRRIHTADWTPCDFGPNSTEAALQLTEALQWARFQGGAGSHHSVAQFRCEDGQVLQSTNAWTELWDSLGHYTNSVQGNCFTCLFGAGAESSVEQCRVQAMREGSTPQNTIKHAQFLFHSQSQLHVQTGGRSVARRNALTRFAGSGVEYLVRSDPQNVTPIGLASWNWAFEFAGATNLVSMPFGAIQVVGGTLDTWGRRYVNLPAGAELDCTPTAAAEYAHFSLTAEDATPTILAGTGNGSTEAEPPLHLLEPSVENPGKVLFASTGDTDGDGIPDLADGFGLFGTPPTNGAVRPFAPIAIRIPTTLDTNRARFRFSYELSAPDGVVVNGNVEDGFTYTPAAGNLRLWTHDGPLARTNAFLQDGGHIVSPSVSYALHDLPFQGTANDPYYEVTLYVESVRASTDIGDQRLQLLVEPDGVDSGLIGVRADEVHFTSLDAVLVAVDSSGNTTPATKLEVSHPSPVVTLSACGVDNVRSSADYQRILGDLNLAGAIQSAVCDFTPGANGTIDEVFVYVNSYDEPVAIVPASGAKTLDESSFLRPFPFSGAFSTNLAGVELEFGLNLIRVTAVDKVFGITGYAEYTVEVTGQRTNQLLQSYADAGAALDFGGITAVAQLDGATPVTLHFTNKATSATYSGVLFKVSDSPLILSNAQAWVDIPDASGLDAALGAAGGGQFEASVSVPALGPLHIAFTLERATNAGPFTFQFVEMQLTANGPLDGSVPDSVVVQVRKGGGGWDTATLTNSTGATNLYSNTGGTFTVNFHYPPSLVATQADEVVVEVTNSAMAIHGLTLGLLETNANGRVFVSDPGLLFLDDDWRGWSLAAATAAPLAASTGGVFKPYALQFLGPPALLDAVTNLAVLDEFGQPVGSRQMVKKGGKHLLRSPVGTALLPAIHLALPGGGLVSEIARGNVSNLDEAAQYSLGFGAGFVQGGVSLVEGTAELGQFVFRHNRLVVTYQLLTGQRPQQDKQLLITTYKAVKPLVDFWIEWRTRQLTEIYDAPNLPEALMDVASQDLRMAALLCKELIIWLEELDANATSYDRGKLQGRVAFEAVTLIVAEMKVGQLTKLTKITFLEKLFGKLQGSTFPRAAKAAEATTEALNTARQFSRTGSYGSLKGNTVAGHQANHLNQNAAFRPRPSDPPGASRIPESEGIAHAILGDAITEPGSPHWRFHRALESFWDQFRRGGARFGERPSCSEYGSALEQALRASGIPDAEVQSLVILARQNRQAFGLAEADAVPRIPRRFGTR